jgi:diaminohydroxyphosphoribosylaminopyrimidine deaminase/5-amino-6-(5-phosphoribosylamino)uracil reductase
VFGAGNAPAQRREALEQEGAEVVLLDTDHNQRLPWRGILETLKAKGQVDVMIEGGGTVIGSAFEAKVIDEVWAFQAPLLLGGGRPAIAAPGPEALSQALRLEKLETEYLGKDQLLRGLAERSVS